MNEILSQSIFFGIAITLVTYEIGLWIKQKTGKAIANHLLISVLLIVAEMLLLHIEYETYAKEINIEAKAMIDIATKQIIPAVIRYTTTLAQSINAVKAACGADISVQTEILVEVSDLLADTKNALSKLEEVTAQGAAMAQGREQEVFYRDEMMFVLFVF